MTGSRFLKEEEKRMNRDFGMGADKKKLATDSLILKRRKEEGIRFF